MALNHQQILESGWREILANMEMDTDDPAERQRRIEAGLEALRLGETVRGKVNGKVIVLNGGK